MVTCPLCGKEVGTFTYTTGEKPRTILKWHKTAGGWPCDGNDRTIEEITAASDALKGRPAEEETS